MSAFLPHRDPHPAKRSRELEAAQKTYRWNHEYVSPLALLDHVPFHDQFSIEWVKRVSACAMEVLTNQADYEKDVLLRKQHITRHHSLIKLIDGAVGGMHAIFDLIHESISTVNVERRAQSLDDYNEQFQKIGLPPISREYTRDDVFAEMRVAGCNPVVIERVQQVPKDFAVTNSQFQVALPGDSLEAAGAEGRLYLADYTMLTDLEASDFPNVQKYIYAPYALFAQDRASRQLVPAAIQCDPIPSDNNPVLSPKDGYNWLIAKTIVEIADATHHQAVSHLGRTHLYLEPFAIATQRQLSKSHPLHLLLEPHFEGTLAINEFARKNLINEGGTGAQMCGATIDSTLRFTASSLQEWRFNEAMPPDTFRRRNIEDPTDFPHYPYRDDSVLYWESILAWVDEYLRIYYDSNSQVRLDTELQAWCRDLISASGGRVVGFGEDGHITTLEYLIEAVAQVIFTASVQHAAVNFPQFDLLSYTPRSPLAGYSPRPTSNAGATESDYLNLLPPIECSMLQTNVLYFLGNVKYTQLSQYRVKQFRDERVREPLERFQCRIGEIGKTIEERNLHRRPYEFLMPAGIPQSINI